MDSQMAADLAKSVEAADTSLEKSFCGLIELSRCPICRKLFNEATTIDLCAHTFCKKCIYRKVKETNCCPKCNQVMGSTPEEHLIPDTCKELLATRVRNSFDRERLAKLQSDDAIPRVADDLTPPGPIAKPDDAAKTVEKSTENESERVSSQESSTLAKATKDKNSVEVDKVTAPASSGGTSESGSETNVNKKNKNKKRKNKKKAAKSTPEKSINVEEKAVDHVSSKGKQKTDDGAATSQPLDLASSKGKQKIVDVEEKQEDEAPAARMPSRRAINRVGNNWIAFVPKTNQRGYSFPKLGKPIIRIKDDNMPIYVIQTFLKEKLNLKSENEVDVFCRGKKLALNQTLYDAQEIWISGLPDGGRPKAYWKVEDLVIELAYSRSLASTFRANT